MRRFLLLPLAIILLTSSISLASGDVEGGDVVKLVTGDASERAKAYEYLKAHHSDENIAVKLKELLIDSDGKRERTHILKALQYYDTLEILPIWEDALKNSKSFIIQREIVSILGKSGSKRCLPALVNQLENPIYSVRENTILALKNIGDDRMFPKIFEMAKSGDPVKKVYALEALYHLYDIRFYPIITDMMKDENKSVRIFVMMCIEKNRLSNAIPLLRSSALNDSNSEVRAKTIDVLASFRDGESLNIFVKSLDSADAVVRSSAALALLKLNTSRSSSGASSALAREKDPYIRDILLDVLINGRDDGGYAGLAKVISSDDIPSLRIKAAYALGVIRGERSEKILLSSLGDPDYRVRAEIYNSLRFYPSDSSLRRMIKGVKEETNIYVRSAALYSLENIRNKSTIIPLYDIYSEERDPLFRSILYESVRNLIKSLI